MKKIINLRLLTVLLCILSVQAFSQGGLYITSGANFFITSGTTVSIDSFALTPSVDYNIVGTNAVTRDATAVPPPLTSYIQRVFHLQAPPPPYSGDITIYYNDAELNGIDESALSLNLYDGTNWMVYPATSRDAANNFVTTAGLSGVVFNQATLASALPPKPTLACYETARFDTETSQWVVTGTKPIEPAKVNCWDNYQFNTTSCTWVNTGTQPTEPAKMNCWDNYQFNTTSCTWVNTGTQPTKPANVNCWDDYQFDDNSCSWVNRGTQPTQPPQVNCWDNYQFDNSSCSWVNAGTQPTKPANVNCWDDYQFDDNSCAWVNRGTQPTKPVNVNCWDDYQFDNSSCSWVNAGTQPTKPANVNCWDDYQFSTTSCTWVNMGTGTTYYADADGDTYGNPNSTTTVCSATPPTGFVSNSSDCDDTRALVHPGAVEVCGNGIDDNCNGQVDENCGTCQNATNLTTTNITATSAKLNWVANVNPLQWQVQYKSTAPGSKWIDLLSSGSVRNVTISGLKEKTSYNWHIRAKCGTKWTSYSNTITFKTLSSTQSMPIVQAKPLEEPTNVVETNSRLTLHPNPSNGRFIINLHLSNNNSTKAKIELVNMLGQTVYTENGSIANGKLQQTVSMSSSMAHGMYIVRVIANNKVYQQKLIYTK